MPQRQRTRTIMTPALQGHDSWVKVKAITVAEAKAFQKLFIPLQKEGDDLREQRTGLDDAVDAEQLAGIDNRLAEIEGETGKMFAEYVIDWNWVDDDGKALPKPVGNPEVFDLLTSLEIGFLSDAINATDDNAKKNSPRR